MEFTIITILKLLLLGVTIGFGIYFAQYTKPFLLWLKSGIEDADGKLHHQDLQIAFFSLLAAFITISYAIWQINYPDAIIYCTFAGAGVLYSVNRITEMVKHKNNLKHGKSK